MLFKSKRFIKEERTECISKLPIIKSIKKHRNQFANKGTYSQSYDFSSSEVQMWELDHKEG